MSEEPPIRFVLGLMGSEAEKGLFKLREVVVRILFEFNSPLFESTLLPLTNVIVSLPLRNEVRLFEKWRTPLFLSIQWTISPLVSGGVEKPV
jgi:hypothetical protein